MYEDKLGNDDLPKVPFERRISAFLIDFVVIWLLSSFFGAFQWLIFLLAWLGMRVVLVDKNQGQSLGRWALDIRVIDFRYERMPELMSLTKREGIVGFAAMLAMYGFQNSFAQGILYLLILNIPLLVDCVAALVDADFNQALHDRFTDTMIVPSQRGFSLDLRLKKIFAELKKNMQKY
ncbi:MAG: RDD family protein [Xenococcaceae cyanobacterium MO_188.B29]|nr:RDD family protein [Xenococcaceae cyanobacterium MO_188.B29]